MSDGSIKWSQLMGSNPANDYEGSIIASDGKLIVLNGDGRLIVLNANPTFYDHGGRVPYETGLSSGCRASAVLANGLLYCRDYAGQVICLSFAGGSRYLTTWERTTL